MKWDSKTYTITDKGNFGTISLVIGIIGLAASAGGYMADSEQLFFSYLTAFAFWFTLAAGGLFLTMLHHLTGATWSVVLRRVAESLMWVLPFMAIFFIPILFGMHDLYHWTHHEAVAEDALLKGKEPFLNMGFFITRLVIYFVVWTGLALILAKLSRNQDSGHSEALRLKFVRTSAPGMILFALTLTFAAFDWLMSLDPHWYSTIFGVYVFAGGICAMFSLLIVLLMGMRKQGVMDTVVTVEHYHDLGKLAFAFMIFWGYMAFSQYFLIWYGNIPEETIWFLHRWEGSWKVVTLTLVFGHFVVPFLIMITRGAKRRLGSLKLLAYWLLLMHLVDMHWLVMPTLHKHGVHIGWIDFAPVIGIGGIFFWIFWNRFASRPVVPVGDPRLDASINFVNH
ncbi:MAG: hypothetical protein R3F48_18090 [Candidatus Zixiibacteriota bacterium]